MRRCPSWMKTIPTITASAMKGIITTKTWSGFVHQLETPGSRPATIEAKISSEMPFPMPRWVISSPIHISSVVPATSVMTIRNSFEKVSVPTMLSPDWRPIVRNRKTKPTDWAEASATVR